MKKVFGFSVLLILGLIGSQILPGVLGDTHRLFMEIVIFLTMTGLSFIMIHVGYEFEIDRSNVRQYGWDYMVAITTAGFPWIFAALYFLYILLPSDLWNSWDAWKEVLLIGRFAAPTATGVLFSMLAAAGLSATWMFRKTRILVIFDDLDTVLLMIPLKIMMVGLAWQLGIVVVVMVILLWVAWRFLHQIKIPVTWPYVLLYSVGIAAVSEVVYFATKLIDYRVPIHIEVLLPAFVLGCIMAHPKGSDAHSDDEREGHQEGPETPEEQRVSTIVSAIFMVLVGLSMPLLTGKPVVNAQSSLLESVTAVQPGISWGAMIFHTLVLTLIINLGKMFPAFCYRKEANWRERLAVALAMCPRGEVGAGIILLSLGYGIGGPVVSVAILALVLNLALTPLFVIWVKQLLMAAQVRRG